MGVLREYAAVKRGMFSRRSAALLCEERSLAGTEVYFDDLVPRDQVLCPDGAAETAVIKRMETLGARRAHASYWAWPTAFLTGRHREELYGRMGGAEGVRAYFGDETGEAIFSRWTAEYALCARLGLESYTFHLIDYAPIDGKWGFTLSRQDILDGMAEMLETLLARLDRAGLLGPDSPKIELENAGWGLEYGAQTGGDFAWVFSRVADPWDVLRVGWDTNHLLHAVGRERFLLPAEEVTAEMAALEGPGLSLRWLRYDLLDPRLKGRVGSVHLSDRPVTETEYFRRGRLAQPWYGELTALPEGDAQEEYGVAIVLGRYDAHIPAGGGYLTGAEWAELLRDLRETNGDFALLHELKNSKDIFADLAAQQAALGGTEL